MIFTLGKRKVLLVKENRKFRTKLAGNFKKILIEFEKEMNKTLSELPQK